MREQAAMRLLADDVEIRISLCPIPLAIKHTLSLMLVLLVCLFISLRSRTAIEPASFLWGKADLIIHYHSTVR